MYKSGERSENFRLCLFVRHYSDVPKNQYFLDVIQMSKYKILPYSYDQAKKLDVVILPSSNPKKKIDVYQKIDVPPLKYSDSKKKNPKALVGSKKVASIGDINYPDYAYHMKTEGKAYADERRRLYRIRHKGEEKRKGKPGFFSWYLLW